MKEILKKIIKDKKTKFILVMGFGKSGQDISFLLLKKGFKIYVSDKEKIKFNEKFNKFKKNILFLTEKEVLNKEKEISFIIKSPGISNDNNLIKHFLLKNFLILSEVETALLFSKTQNYIMITGTNGKTTTTTLTGLILREFFKNKKAKTFICGNIGYSVSKAVLNASKKDWLVIEISSYQAENFLFIKPKISAILNITPDHIEHHKTMNNYINAKSKVFINQDKNDFCILNYDDKILRNLSSKIKSKILFFSSKTLNQTNAFLLNDKIKIKFLNKNYIFSSFNLIGKHNFENIMTACLISLSLKIPPKTIQKVINSFKGIVHRIELVKEIKGVKYINDSKATNVDSTLIALKALGKDKNIWLILGGLDKKSPYKPLIPFIKKYVKKVLTIGMASKIIKKELKNSCEILDVKNLKNAISMIYKNALKNDIALLSPACASYDQFNNFEDRGEKFKKEVLSYVKDKK